MTDRKWTAGPWDWEEVDPGNKAELCDVTAPSGFVSRNVRGISNARLISAAPDMAKALEHLLMAIDLVCEDAPYDPSFDVARARAALAKARGDK